MKKQQSADRILYLLKTRGPQTVLALAEDLDMTPMGARQHVKRMQGEGLVESYERAESVGRPRQYWALTDRGNARFPDRHADLTLSLLQQVKTLFGDEGLERLIAMREIETEQLYRDALSAVSDLGDRVRRLAELRSAEGYMAEALTEADGSWLLVENHCPICAAAAFCQGFCRSELAIFQRVLDAEVQRVSFIQEGDRRCAYRILARPPVVEPMVV